MSQSLGVSLAGLEFRITRNTCATKMLGAGEQCSITVQFDPSRVGLARGKLQVTNSTTGGSAHADLFGFAF